MNRNDIVVLLIINILLLLGNEVKCYGQISNNGYVIEGALNGLEDHVRIYLTKSSNGRTLDTISSTYSRDDKFYFEGKVPLEEIGMPYFIFIEGKEKILGREGSYVLLYIENSSIEISGDITSLDPLSVIVKGSRVHADMVELTSRIIRLFSTPLKEVFDPAYSKLLYNIKDDTSSVARNMKQGALKLREMIYWVRCEYVLDWIKSHPYSLAAPRFFMGYTDSLKSRWNLLYDQLRDSVKNAYWGQEFKAMLDLKKRIAVGQIAPGLILNTPAGTQLSLHDVTKRSKLTLVDFWAYWCIPCRESFPKLKELYAKYHDKGLSIYGVSIDTGINKWLGAVEADRLPWNNVILKDKDTAKELYGITFIPASFLLDDKGRIIETWLGENKNIEKIISEILN